MGRMKGGWSKGASPHSATVAPGSRAERSAAVISPVDGVSLRKYESFESGRVPEAPGEEDMDDDGHVHRRTRLTDRRKIGRVG